MRHIFLQSVSIPLLTHLMIEPAIVCLLIFLAGLALFFCARQRSAGWAETVATIAMSADAYELMTTLAFKNTAVWKSHPQAPSKGLYRNTRKSDALYGCIARVTADAPRGPGVAFLAPTSIGAEPSISQDQPARNICAGVSQAETRKYVSKKEEADRKGGNPEYRRKTDQFQGPFP
jgi:hypothetical protein